MKDPNALSYCLGSRHNKYNLLFIFISIIAFEIILFTLAIVPSALEYEVSLHDIYPVWFWVLIGLLTLLPIVYLFITQLSKADWFSWKTAYWLLGSSCAISILTKFFPLIRGYYTFGAGDTLTHYGIISDILTFGVNDPNNHYPFVHTHVALSSLISGMTPELSALLLHSAIYAFFLLSFLLIGRHFFNNQNKTILLVSLIAIPMYSNELLSINLFGYWLIFFFLYLVVMAFFNDKLLRPYLIISVIYAITFWYVHPETVIFSMMMIGIIAAVYFVYNRIYPIGFRINIRSAIIMIFILGIGWIYIFSGMSAFGGQISILEAIYNTMNINEGSAYEELLTSDYTVFENAILAIMMYGRSLFITLVGYLFTIYLIFGIGLKKIGVFNAILISLLYLYSVFALVNMISGTTTGLNPNRMLKTIIILAILIISYNIFKLLSVNRKKIIPNILLILLFMSIIASIFLGVGTLYGNPYLNSYNAQVNAQDYYGMNEFYNMRSDFYLIDETPSRQFQSRYAPYIFGAEYQPTINIRSFITTANDLLPIHFGYEKNQSFGSLFNNKIYYLLYPPFGEFERMFVDRDYLNGGINANDVSHLNMDSSSNRILNNGEFSIYLVNPV